MKQFILKNKKAIGAITTCLLIGGVMLSFDDTNYANQVLKKQEQAKDTVPLKEHNGKMTMKEFDKLSENLDKDMLKVADEMKNIDLENIQRQIEMSLKAVDMDKIMKEVEASLSKVDMDKIMAEVESSMKAVDWEKTNLEVKDALKEAKEELEKAKIEMKNINQDEINKELENVRHELERTKEELKKIDVDKIMEEAKEGINTAKLELKEMKTMFTEMENDGLINSKQGFKIEYKNKNLYINGEKQKESVTGKYRKYFKDEHFEIEIDKE